MKFEQFEGDNPGPEGGETPAEKPVFEGPELLEKELAAEGQELERRGIELQQRKGLVDGRELFAALSNMPEIFKKAYREDNELNVARAELAIKEYELDIRRGQREANAQVEESQKRNLDTWRWVVEERKGQGADQYMQEIKDRLYENKDGDFLRTVPMGREGYYEENPGIYAVSGFPQYSRIGRRKGRREMGLINALQERYDNYQKESRGSDPQEKHTLQELRGVALGALEAGHTRPALEALWFTEMKVPMDELTKAEFDRRLAEMDPNRKAEFLKELYRVIGKPHAT